MYDMVIRTWMFAGVWMMAVVCFASVKYASASPLDKRIDAAIRSGLQFLYEKQQSDGQFKTRFSADQPTAVESLMVLTALSAGEKPSHKSVALAIEYINRAMPENVRSRALRAMVYSRLDREQYARQLAADVAWLIKHQQSDGGWGHGPGHEVTIQRPLRSDTSNSYLAGCALLDADKAGIKIPPETWAKCKTFWTKGQNFDGGWGYEPPTLPANRVMPASYGSATTLGTIACSMLERKLLELAAAPYDKTGQRTSPQACDIKAMEKGLDWLTSHGNKHSVHIIPKALFEHQNARLYQYHFHLSQAGRESGLGRFSEPLRRMRVSAMILARQTRKGQWTGGNRPDSKDRIVTTCYALSALIRTRSPILINKLTIGVNRQSDFYDAANLTRWCEKSLGYSIPLSWRRLDESFKTAQLTQAPILYINGKDDFRISDDAAKAMREYYLRKSGAIIVHAQAGDRNFASQAEKFFLKLFPEYRAGHLPKTHLVYNLKFKIPADDAPHIIGIGDSLRTRIFIITSDLNGAWHNNHHKQYPHAFQLVANIALYTTDMVPLKSDLTFVRRAAAPAPQPAPERKITVGRTKHSGNWNAGSMAMPQLSNVLRDAVSIGIAEKNVTLNDKVPYSIPLLWLTGTEKLQLNPTQLRNLKDYVQNGGMLFIDPATGDKKFFKTAKELLIRMFGKKNVLDATPTSPILTGNFSGNMGCDVTTAGYSRIFANRTATPKLWQVKLKNRVAVVLSRHGVTCPIEGIATCNCRGLSTPDAQRLAANVILYAVSH